MSQLDQMLDEKVNLKAMDTPETPASQALHGMAPVKASKNLQEAIHLLLTIGVGTSTTLLLFGLLLTLLTHQTVPDTFPGMEEVFNEAFRFQPAGFLGLGLLALIATPILRVFGSLVAFIFERDWRFAGITFVVFIIVLASIFFGRA
jgi:uncharacterized membrane protein